MDGLLWPVRVSPRGKNSWGPIFVGFTSGRVTRFSQEKSPSGEERELCSSNKAALRGSQLTGA